MSARALVLGVSLASACAHHKPSPFTAGYYDEPISPETKVMLVAGGDDVANFAAEIVEQRRMWWNAGLGEHEIACYWAQPTKRAWARDARQYRQLAPALAGCRPASAARVLADIAAIGDEDPPWFYLYVTSHGVQALAGDRPTWYLEPEEREFVEQPALSLDAGYRLQQLGDILAARRAAARDHELVMTPKTLRRALDRLPEGADKIVILQGCFTGSFLVGPDSLAALPNTTVLTAAAPDRPSFGCGSGTRTTFWGGALNRELRKRVHRGLTPPEVDWRGVHEAVLDRVTRLERTRGHKPSRPHFDPP